MSCCCQGEEKDSSKSEIKIGTVKQNAIKAMLQGLTPKSYKMIVTHNSLMQGESWLIQCQFKSFDIISVAIVTVIYGDQMMLKLFFCEEETSALPDPVLASKHIWPYSPVPDGHRPNEAEEIARRAAQSAVKFMVNDKLTLLGLMMKCTCNESKSC